MIVVQLDPGALAVAVTAVAPQADLQVVRIGCIPFPAHIAEDHGLVVDIIHDQVEPVYHSMKGWAKDLTGLTSHDELPEELNQYIRFLEVELNVPITIVSVGPDRNQTLFR